jgi:hypothetical protein
LGQEIAIVRHRLIAAFAVLTVLGTAPLLTPSSSAQNAGELLEEPARPIPRLPDGRVNFGSPPGEPGIWQPWGRPLLADPVGVPITANDRQGRAAFSGPPFPGKPSDDDVPFQPWARAIYAYRETNLFEPYIRCKPSGGARPYVSPFGVEFVDQPETQTIFQFDGNLHTWRIIYLDDRSHPEDLAPSYYGHSIGHWEGDTLVIDTVGFNERFWIDRQGMPHTDQLHLIERLTRTEFGTMKYEMTIDDPGAYTETWTTGFYLEWVDEVLYEYICQENNQAIALEMDPAIPIERVYQIVP